MHYFSSFLAAALLCTLPVSGQQAEFMMRAQRAQEQGWKHGGHHHHWPHGPPHYPPQHQNKTHHFLTPKTAKFAVDGKGLPDVNFDIGESYAGLLPISGDADETRELFFWFFPARSDDPPKEVAIWLNGGPGCSSLGGFISENGPFLWQAGTFAPVENPYSFNNLTNYLWVEQPVGVGFTQGVPNISDEVELSKQFVGFYEQFVKTFEVQKYDLYLTGESYAGYYVPYIANEFIEVNSPDMPLKGVAINDPIIGDETIQQAVVIQPFVEYWGNLLNLNETFLADLAALHESCGYGDYLEKYFTFPAPQSMIPPLPDAFSTDDGKCDTFSPAVTAATVLNPCFNVYHVSDYCPLLWSVNGPIGGGYLPPGATVYFNRTDVQKAINAPVGTNWAICTPTNVFGGPTNNQSLSDQSLGPAQNDVLRNVIEHTNNVIIGSGNLDILLSTNGTLFALQNTTWNGYQGFKEYPSNDFFVPSHDDTLNPGAMSGSGLVGKWGSERGLTFYIVQLAGHQIPEYLAGAAYRSIELMLGHVDSLSDTGPFTTA